MRTSPGCASALPSRGSAAAIRSASSSRSACIRRACFSSWVFIFFRIVTASGSPVRRAASTVLEDRTNIFEDRHNATRADPRHPRRCPPARLVRPLDRGSRNRATSDEPSPPTRRPAPRPGRIDGPGRRPEARRPHPHRQGRPRRLDDRRAGRAPEDHGRRPGHALRHAFGQQLPPRRHVAPKGPGPRRPKASR